MTYPSTFANWLLGGVTVDGWGAVLFQCLGVVIYSPPPRGTGSLPLHNEYVLARRNKASLFIHLAKHHGKCSTVCLVTPITKLSFASSGVRSWRPLCWTMETVGFGPTWVCLPPRPLFYQYDTVFTKLLENEVDSLRGRDLKGQRNRNTGDVRLRFQNRFDVVLCLKARCGISRKTITRFSFIIRLVPSHQLENSTFFH